MHIIVGECSILSPILISVQCGKLCATRYCFNSFLIDRFEIESNWTANTTHGTQQLMMVSMTAYTAGTGNVFRVARSNDAYKLHFVTPSFASFVYIVSFLCVLS